MARLTSRQRARLPESDFTLPGEMYPVPDKSHAVNAKARASQQEARGNLTSAEKAKVDAAADRVLHEAPCRGKTSPRNDK